MCRFFKSDRFSPVSTLKLSLKEVLIKNRDASFTQACWRLEAAAVCPLSRWSWCLQHIHLSDPPQTPVAPPAMFKVRGVIPARRYSPWWNLNSQWQDAGGLGAVPPRSARRYTTPRGAADLSFISDTLPAGAESVSSSTQTENVRGV